MVVKSCREDVCAYYQYLQGTSMATPHAAGVAALAVSRFGRLGTGAPPGGNPVASDSDGLTLEPYLTTLALWASAVQRPCPSPAAYTYTVPGSGGRQTFTHVCEQGVGRNGFYGHGVVSAAGVAALPALGTLPPNAAQPARR
jgi:subtilisin family serine protease